MPEALTLMDPRPVRAEEVPSVLALIDRCYRGYGLTLNLEDECEAHLQRLDRSFRDRGGDFWVVVDGGGVVRATAALCLHDDGSTAELKSMYVDPGCRRRGLGSALTRLVMAEARKRGRRRLELWSDTRFEAAHAMYESLGFVRTGRRDLTDSNNSSEWGYELAIDGWDEPRTK